VPILRRPHLAGALIAALVVTPFSGAPADATPERAASSHSRAVHCFDPASFGLTAANAGPGSDPTDAPEMSVEDQAAVERHTDEIIAEKKANGTLVTADVVTIPVWFHNFHSLLGMGYVPDSTFQKQIDVMNKAYSGGEGGTDTGFRFTLAGVDHIPSDLSWTMLDLSLLRTLYHRGGRDTLNVNTAWMWFGTFSGFSPFPWGYEVPGLDQLMQVTNKLDSIMLNPDTLPGGSWPDKGLGETLVHETGHWLGLYHTFQGGCEDGDQVADTPAQAEASSGCPTDADTCTAPGLDPIHNYMDYSSDLCQTGFTPGQAERMKKNWQAYRA
jgi:hypothetical protein